MNYCSSVLLFIFFSLLSIHSKGQLPDTEIYIATVNNIEHSWVFGEAENITNRPGYDNQPCFSPDGKNLLFVEIQDSLASEVVSYSFEHKSKRKITNSPESEYSPSLSPDQLQLSVVRVDLDSAQRFYVLSAQNPKEATFIPETDSVGYYCWLNDSLLAMFLVGKDFSLQVLNTKSNLKTFISYNIGRCLKLTADKKHLLYIDKSDSTNWMINKMQISDFSISPVVKSIQNNEDFCPLPDGSLLMGDAGKLYIWNHQNSPDWEFAMDYSASIGPFYRITVNNDGSKIAFVAYSGLKP